MSIRPPGPNGVPLFGNGQQFADDPFEFMTACADAYGDVVNFDLGPIPLYMLTNPRDINRVLVSEPERFPKLDLGDDAIYDLLGDGLLLSGGETWQQQRELANPAFHGRRIRTLGDTMVDHTESMLDEWADGDHRDIQIEMARLTVRIIVTAMLGTDIEAGRIRTVQENLEPTASSARRSTTSKRSSTTSSPSDDRPATRPGPKPQSTTIPTSRWTYSRCCCALRTAASRPTSRSATR